MISTISSLTVLSSAPIIYSYDSYYQTLPDAIFSTRTKMPAPDIKHGRFKWGDNTLMMSQAHVFPSEETNGDDLGHRPDAYRSGELGCIEGQPSASSGTTVRHFAVYLIDARARKKPKLYKLPSLFGSCKGVRLGQGGQLLFDDVEYLYAPGADRPNGVIFIEQRIRGQRFERTGKTQQARFVEEGNVWKFALE